MGSITCNRDPKSSAPTRAEYEELAKCYGGLIEHQYEQLARQWLFWLNKRKHLIGADR
jgi:hypothetical protein